MRSFMRKKGFKYLIGIAVGVAAPFLLGLAGTYWVHILVIVVIFANVAVSLNLIMGYTGQINLGHIAFFGIGAYTTALLMLRLDVSFWVTLVAGGMLAVILSFILGYISLGLRGIYFALATFAFLMVVGFLLINFDTFTGGARGLFGIPHPSIGGFVFEPTNRLAWFYLAFVFLLFTIFIVDRVLNSRVGRAFIAIREDEELAKSTGINTTMYKVLSFGVSAFLAGVAGGIYVAYMGAITPADCAILPTLLVIAMCAIGGMGTMLGPILGAVVVQLLPELLRPIREYYYFTFGFMIVLITIFAPEGIMGAITSLQARLTARGSKEDVRV